MSDDLTDKVVLVTGGTRGIGLAIVERFLKAGARVYATSRTSQTAPSGCELIKVDFAESQATAKFMSEVNNIGIDVLINNAGINKLAPFASIDTEDFDRIQQVNLRAPFQLCQAVIPRMVDNRWGRIVNISSIFGKISREFRASYSASKFALDGMSLALALEVAKHNVLVNVVAPGFIDTELTRSILGDSGVNELVAQVPMKRLGQATEIAELVYFLASPSNTYLTGQNIAIDGGFSRI